MICVALNYEGTESPLTSCIVDSERIISMARKSGCKDITKLYDNGETSDFPCKDEVAATIAEVGSRCRNNDYLVFFYSGHGGSVENEDAPTGTDCTLCLRTRDGEDDELVDDEIANLITEHVPPSVRVLVLVDACHSGGIMDMDTPGLWGGRRVVVISGCREGQCSQDTGDGGAMTNALVGVLNRKKIKAKRKMRSVSVQFVFNRMVAAMPDGEEDEEEDDEGDESDDWASEDEDWDSDDEDGADDEEDEEDEEEEPGQDITLSWPGGQDPCKITFPF